MRTRLIPAAIAAGLVLTLTACSSDDPKAETKPDTSSGQETPTEKAESPAAPEKPSVIGDTITIRGTEPGQQVALTLKKITDPAKSSEDVFGPEKGQRWVGIQMEIANTGTVAIEATPKNQLADADGQRYAGVIADITAGPAMPFTVKLPPGDKALGWQTIELPANAKLASFTFEVIDGADRIAHWKLS
ncbi:hypothetical protein ABZ714_30665 [Streptomyces sp. NPDC006798]|uniref:hypothetical protein n=1 Tax=unclassified Streptomyces TaxID=2593676 RepID=UPI00332093D4